MARAQAVNFNLIAPTGEQLAEYGSSSIEETHTAFSKEFERLYSPGAWSRTPLPTETGELQAALRRHPDTMEPTMNGPEVRIKDQREFRFRRIWDLADRSWYAAALVLTAKSLEFDDMPEGQEAGPDPSGQAFPALRVQYGVEAPRPGLLLDEVGLSGVIRANVFDTLEHGWTEVFDTGDVIASMHEGDDRDDAYKVAIVKRAFGSVTDALRLMPDGEEVDTSGFRTVHELRQAGQLPL